MEFRNEIIKNLKASEYHGLKILSKSKLDDLARSPEYFKYKWDEEVDEKTKAMDFGSLFHCLLLTPEEFDNEFAVEPEVNKRTNEGKAILEEFYEEHGHKIIVSIKDIELAGNLIDAVKRHPIAGKLVEGGEKEVSMFWEQDGVQFKGRIDQVKDGLLIDYKTSTTAKPEEFEKKAYDYDYHKQAYLYKTGYEKVTGTKVKGFIFVTVEKEAPYSVCVFLADDLLLKVGKIETDDLIRTFKTCSDKENWYGYNGLVPYIQNLSVPYYVQSKYKEELGI